MKKNYHIPETLVLAILPTTIICASVYVQGPTSSGDGQSEGEKAF